jgi:hypothetical protein
MIEIKKVGKNGCMIIAVDKRIQISQSATCRLLVFGFRCNLYLVTSQL